MDNKSQNEILREQRKARRDFIELKKMQHGEMDAGPKPSEVAIVPKTPMEKLKNIWFHDKWVILGVAALVIVMAVMVAQCASRTDYDLEVVMFAHTYVADDIADPIAAYFEQYCEDLNGDGEVHIQVINCSYDPDSTDTQYRYSMSSKLQAIIAADANALLFITDTDAYDYLNSISETAFFEGEPLALNDEFYSECDKSELISLPEGLQISCRRISNTTIEKEDDIKGFYDASQKILKALGGE